MWKFTNNYLPCSISANFNQHTKQLRFQCNVPTVKIDPTIKIDGCKLDPADNVKYLGVHIDKFVSWDFHITQLSNKLSRANGILSKLRHFTSKETLLSV